MKTGQQYEVGIMQNAVAIKQNSTGRKYSLLGKVQTFLNNPRKWQSEPSFPIGITRCYSMGNSS